ncbi:ComEA family DNA-binding protein [Rudaeicoccus suwonensis]|uniref:Competence protein ComEA n=1 Tax=Rudaeicoccus suwonensis TaxID=657409 RepID=A0A561ECI2_9MICO|nr:ComEA family DNA-binding protein [Rudaeicoccus suwonensis]TWE13297.1 competence protein ComEA [Rudaeicoccus suwonensis]
MPRSRSDAPVPDRLAAVLEELEAVRRAPGWVPTSQTLLDQPRSTLSELPRRIAEFGGRGAADELGDGETEELDTSSRTRRDLGGRAARHRATGDSEIVRPHEPLVRTPSSLRDPLLAPSRLAVIGAVVLVLVAAVVFGGRAVLARASSTPRPLAAASALASASSSGSPSSRSGFGSGADADQVASGSPSSSGQSIVVVQVVGQVRKPGVVEIRTGSRVRDAVEAAGGALPTADLAAVNLARVVTDGEQIQVPKPGESIAPPAGATGSGGAGGGSATGSGAAGAVVDINTADAAGLDSLPGVGPVLAERIIQWRQENGRFTSVDDLGEVSGIGEKMLERLRPLVRVG